MLKRTAAITTILIAFCVSAMAQDLTDPKEIISKTKKTLLGLKSYGFTIEKEGWDFNMDETAEATESLSGEASGSRLTKKFVKDVDEVDASKPQWMTYNSEIMFSKPWTLRMKLVKNDYLPDILQGGVMRYIYSKKKWKKWSINTASIPIALPRGVETESGNFLYSNWNLNLIDLENLAKDIEPELIGIEEVAGRKAYKIGFKFETKPTTNKADLKAWGVPKELHFKVEPEIGWFVTNSDNIKDAYFYIDTEKFVLLREEVFQTSGEVFYDKVWKKVRLNDITKKEITSKR